MAGHHLNINAKALYAISFASISLVADSGIRKTLVLQSEAELRQSPATR